MESADKKTTRQAKSLIEEGHAEADALFLSIGEGAIVTDATGRVSRVNKAALDILGFKKEELIGRWYPEAVIAEDEHGNVLSNYSRPIAQVFLTGEIIKGRIYYRRKDATVVPVSINIAPVLQNNKPIGAIEVFRDISHELALEQAKDDFITIASHQLRTPATGVKQYAGMLLEGYAEKLTPKQRNLLDKAYQNNERQLEIIQDLLNVARLDAGKISLNIIKTDLIKLLRDVIGEQSIRIASRNQSMTFIHPRQKLSAMIDAERIRMVFENIIDNAIKYSPAGKNIKVSAYGVKDRVVVKIRDEGVGIPKEELQKLFQKFQRIPNAMSVEAGGTGLGLYWAEKIVKLHGGKITISSQENRGSSFNIYLPLTKRRLKS
jgi:PAS domain S-box-containing protein